MTIKNHYKLVKATHEHDFDRQCNELERQGYRPFGSIAIATRTNGVESTTIYAQQWKKIIVE